MYLSILFDSKENKNHNYIMEIEDALAILGLDRNASINELNVNFRKLAKKYHPDFHRGNESRANLKMTELNLAYEKALRYLTSTGENIWKNKTRSVNFNVQFNRGINQVMDGMYLFYQYGLENVHLRGEGVRKFRYRDSLREVKKGIEELELLKNYAAAESEKENINTFIDFSKAFLQNMLIKKYFIPTGSQDEHNAYRHYANGSAHLDYSIKDVFFGDNLIINREGSFYTRLGNSYEEFMIVLTKYYRTSWVPETVIKVYLIEVLTRVIKLFKSMQY